MPKLNSVFLTSEEEKKLERSYQNVGGSAWDQEIEAPIVESPNLSKFPRHQRSLRPTSLVTHSRATKDLVSALQDMHNMSASTLNNWERIQDTYPDPAKETSRAQEAEEEEVLNEDLVDHSMAEESDENDEMDATQIFTESSRPHDSIALGFDTEDEDPDDDQDSDLSDFVVNDAVVEKSRVSSSIIVSSSPVAVDTTPQPNPYYQEVQLPATQDTEDELPDIATVVGRKGKDSLPSRMSVGKVIGARGRKRPAVFEDDSDE